MDSALSVAWVEDGEVVCFQLISHSGPGSYVGLSSWRSNRAPGDVFAHLLSAVANLCYYDAGGDFLFHGSPVNAHSEALTRAYLGDQCTRLEEHEAELRLPIGEAEARGTGEAEGMETAGEAGVEDAGKVGYAGESKNAEDAGDAGEGE